jgi:Secretion system C-terminal sorting domain
MKTLLLFFSITLTLFANGQTSVYHPFPDSNAVWNFHFLFYCMGGGGTSDELFSITISGDTVINGQIYHKLTTPFVQSYSTGNCGGISKGYKGAIRQETTDRKVFIVPPSGNTEQLLYDFTMHVGDTVKGYIETIAPLPDIVQSIDSVLVGNTYHKRWNINTCYNIHFIEGIGSTYGLVVYSPGCITDLPDYSITCFQQNGRTLYPDTTANCALITSVNSIEKEQGEIKISPNPSNGSFIVDLGQSMNIKEIRLTDLLGKIVFQQQTDKQSKIKITVLLSGTYILTAIDKDNKSTIRKIIISP